MITLRYKPMKDGKFSIYLDIYATDKSGKTKRNYEFLKIHVLKDYSKIKNVLAIDREKVELAKAIKAKYEVELINNEYDFRKKKANIDFIEYVEKNYDTDLNNIYILLKHIRDYTGSKSLSFAEINYNWVEGFKKHLQSDMLRIRQNTVHNYLRRFKTILNRAVKSDIISVNPFRNVQIPALIETDRTTLDLEEIKLLIKTQTRTKFNSQIRQMFLFSCFSGLRLSDCRALTWNDIENEQIKIRIRKTKKLLCLPLTEQAKEILKEIVHNPDNDKIFWSIPALQNINLYLRIWGLEAGLKKHLHFHVGRHSFATIGLSAGIDLYTMKELLGHKRIEHTMVYAKIVDDKKKIEIAKFPTL